MFLCWLLLFLYWLLLLLCWLYIVLCWLLLLLCWLCRLVFGWLFSSRGCFRELQPLFRRIIRLNGFRLNDDGCVIPLDVPAFCFHRSRDIAGCGSYCHHADDYYFSHIFSFLLLRWILSDNFSSSISPTSDVGFPEERSGLDFPDSPVPPAFRLSPRCSTAPACSLAPYSRRSISTPFRTANLCRSCT